MKCSKQKCNRNARWRSEPCDNSDHKLCTGHRVWCEDCVPLCEVCNEGEPNSLKWTPCVEISKIPIRKRNVEEDIEFQWRHGE